MPCRRFLAEWPFIAWDRGPDRPDVGHVVVHDLATGDEFIQTDAARGRLEWQPVSSEFQDYPPFGAPAIVGPGISLAEESIGPGMHFFEITVGGFTGATPEVDVPGTVEVSVDGGEPEAHELANGMAQFAVSLDEGEHVVAANTSASAASDHRRSSRSSRSTWFGPAPSVTSLPRSSRRRSSRPSHRESRTAHGRRVLPEGHRQPASRWRVIARALDLPAGNPGLLRRRHRQHHETIQPNCRGWLFRAGATSDRSVAATSWSSEHAASLLARALDLAPGTQDYFSDDDNGTHHEANINRLAEAGVTIGCGSMRFCPFRSLTREEMTALLYRASISLAQQREEAHVEAQVVQGREAFGDWCRRLWRDGAGRRASSARRPGSRSRDRPVRVGLVIGVEDVEGAVESVAGARPASG